MMLTFGEALEELKAGNSVARSGWNGRDMHIYYLDGLNVRGTPLEPCIVMYTAQKKHQPGWLASQADMLADDWEVV
jgi:hypothetical protein